MVAEFSVLSGPVEARAPVKTAAVSNDPDAPARMAAEFDPIDLDDRVKTAEEFDLTDPDARAKMVVEFDLIDQVDPVRTAAEFDPIDPDAPTVPAKVAAANNGGPAIGQIVPEDPAIGPIIGRIAFPIVNGGKTGVETIATMFGNIGIVVGT